MAARISGATVLGFTILQILSLTYFFSAHFPSPPSTSSECPVPTQRLQDLLDSVVISHALRRETALRPSAAPYSRMILMVVDALRFDYAAALPFLQHARQENVAMLFSAAAGPPTVTMPRLKAILTGTEPQFLDAVRNFASGAVREDSLVQRLHESGKRLHFYGDDTWLRMFPTLFEKHEGTTSFFVSDTVEVDDNVTRNVMLALASPEDWDVLILHYLGLDHIGHLGGETDARLIPKLQEMNDVLQLLYGKTTESEMGEETLVVLCSDHGMTHAGGHGGASLDETSTVFALLSQKLRSTSEHERGRVIDREGSVMQVDIATTLSVLLGVTIPCRTSGSVIQHPLRRVGGVLFELWGHRQALLQRLTLLEEWDSAFYSLKINWEHGDTSIVSAEEAVLNSLDSHEECVICLTSVHSPKTCNVQCERAIVYYTTLYDALSEIHPSGGRSEDSASLAVMGLAALALCSAWWWRQLLVAAGPHPSPLHKWFILAALVHAVSYASSSFIEEEQETISFFTASFFFAIMSLGASSCKPSKCFISFVGGAALLTITRRWNASGVKIGEVDLLYPSDMGLAFRIYQSIPSNLEPWIVAVCMGIVSFVLVSARTFIDGLPVKGKISPQPTLGRRVFHQILQLAALGGIAAHHIAMVLPEPRGSWCSTAAQYGAGTAYASTTLSLIYAASRGGKLNRVQTVSYWIHPVLILMTLWQRPHNAVLLALELVKVCGMIMYLRHIQRQSTSQVRVSDLLLAMIWMGRSSYYLFGSGNSIDSVDFAGAYAGLPSYSPGLVGAIIFLKVYTGPILWGYGIALASLDVTDGTPLSLAAVYVLATRSTLLLSAATLSFVMSTHLFAWSVFAPKLLFEVGWLAADIFVALPLYFLSSVVSQR